MSKKMTINEVKDAYKNYDYFVDRTHDKIKSLQIELRNRKIEFELAMTGVEITNTIKEINEKENKKAISKTEALDLK